MERTLAIVKPDGVERRVAGRVLARIEEEGFEIVALRMVRMSRREAEGFYAVHRDKPFFNDLTAFMSSGPALVMAGLMRDLRELKRLKATANLKTSQVRREAELTEREKRLQDKLDALPGVAADEGAAPDDQS